MWYIYNKYDNKRDKEKTLIICMPQVGTISYGYLCGGFDPTKMIKIVSGFVKDYMKAVL